ncbi:MAG TPA: hypothetical protein VH370_15965 [Humisphaera sp.]|jgi:hypothetical protein|nr:hypothetical protein [Humisphaera sp.]
MQGGVYHLALSDVDEDKPHLHLVVLTFSGNRDCIVVPAYSTDGPAVNDFIQTCLKSGMREDEIYARLDNAKYLTFPSGFPAKEAYWCISRPRRVAQSTVLSGRFLGTMKPQGVLQIVSRLLASLQSHSPSLLSPKAVKSLRNYAKSLMIECGVADGSVLPPEEPQSHGPS